MQLPILIEQLYGTFTLTGLYSFEFVTKDRDTITEIFFMIPPKNKTMTESTRSTTQPTLSGNYNLDAGNATKQMVLSGELYFPYVGSPDNPVARFNDGLANTIDGMTEFFKLRWMLLRYRDYTMTKKAKMTVPTSVMSFSKEINILYKRIAKKVRDKVGALYDEVKLIVHDYDMDDHWYCRVDTFSSSQDSKKHIATEYTIQLECYEPDFVQRITNVTQVKKTTNENVDIVNNDLQNMDFSSAFNDVQAEIGYNSSFVSASVAIEDVIDNISTENEAIQSGQSTALNTLPTLINTLLTNIDLAYNSFLETFLTDAQRTSYDAGTLTLDEVLNIDVLTFYNVLQGVEIAAKQLKGIINSIPEYPELRYYANADDYTLTTDQFDSGDENKVENDISFYYYTVMDGDTSTLIASRELHDPEKFISILQVNDLSENDFIDGTLIGQQIKIPINVSATSRGDDNLVYSNDPTDIERFLYGTDIATDEDKNILVSATGDLLGVSGLQNVYEAILRRVTNNKGSLNTSSPGWGTIPVDDGNAPTIVKIQKYITDLITQIQSDPRVESVQMDMDKLSFTGEVLSTSSKVYFIGTELYREVST